MATTAAKHVERLHGTPHRLAAITGYEQQTAQFSMAVPDPNGGPPNITEQTVTVDYIAFLTDAGKAHMAALRPPDGSTREEVVAYSSGLPRHFIVTWHVHLDHKDPPLDEDEYLEVISASLKNTIKEITNVHATPVNWHALGLGGRGFTHERVQATLHPTGTGHWLRCALSVRPEIAEGTWLEDWDLRAMNEWQEIQKALVSPLYTKKIHKGLKAKGQQVPMSKLSVSQPMASTPCGRPLWATTQSWTPQHASAAPTPCPAPSCPSCPTCPAHAPCRKGPASELELAASSATTANNALHRDGADRDEWQQWEEDVLASFLGGALIAGGAVAMLWYRSSPKEEGTQAPVTANTRESVPLMSAGGDL